MARTATITAPLARVLAATMSVTALIGGYAHLKLYNDGYKDIPVGNIGRQFLLNAVGAAAIAIGLVIGIVLAVAPAWIGRAAAAGGVLWGAISMIAFFVARTSGGWFGFTDQPGLNPSPEAALAVFSEGATIVLGVAILVTGVVTARR